MEFFAFNWRISDIEINIYFLDILKILFGLDFFFFCPMFVLVVWFPVLSIKESTEGYLPALVCR